MRISCQGRVDQHMFLKGMAVRSEQRADRHHDDVRALTIAARFGSMPASDRRAGGPTERRRQSCAGETFCDGCTESLPRFRVAAKPTDRAKYNADQPSFGSGPVTITPCSHHERRDGNPGRHRRIIAAPSGLAGRCRLFSGGAVHLRIWSLWPRRVSGRTAAPPRLIDRADLRREHDVVSARRDPRCVHQ